MDKNIFHIINRGVEKRKIFLANIRFIHNISDFNSVDNAPQLYVRRRNAILTEVAPPSKQLIDMPLP